jgi:ubiquinone/menaquinone biosynthesis C-methylase UbiE
VKERRLFARFYERLSRAMESTDHEYREEVAGGAGGAVLEVGVGNGLNLSRYRRAERVVAVDPQDPMLRLAAPRAAEAPVPAHLVRARAESLPFADGAFDTVVASLVLCSVDDPGRVAREIRRVLRPGGELRFWEHVRSRARWAAALQRGVTPVWKLWSGGCHPARDTVATLRSAGFDVAGRSFPVGPPSPARPHVLGTARLPG